MPRLAPASKSKKAVDVSDIDPNRALRTIRLLGGISLLLVVIAGVSLWWGSRGADALRINATATQENKPVTVTMEARMTSNGKPIRTGDTVTEPIVVVHGVLADFGLLREGLDGLSVTVRGTRVDIMPETGEFSERVVLKPGKNQIEFGVWWEGRQWQRQHAEITYEKPADAVTNTNSL
jgi:hypothetical protein